MRYIEMLADGWDNVFKTHWPTETLLAITQLYRRLKDARDTWLEARSELIRRYAELDANGNVLVGDNGEAVVPEDKRAELLRELAQLDFAAVIVEKVVLPRRSLPEGLAPIDLALILDCVEFEG